MSRRKQSKPRHVDNEGLALTAAATDPVGPGMEFRQENDREDDHTNMVKFLKDRNGCEDEEGEDGSMDHVHNSEDMSSDAVSPMSGSGKLSACEKCGICFSDPGQYLAHKKLCGNRNRLLMPYDPPVNGLLQNGYDLDSGGGGGGGEGGGGGGVIEGSRKRTRKGVVRRVSGEEMERMRDIGEEEWREERIEEEEGSLLNGADDIEDNAEADVCGDELRNSRLNEETATAGADSRFRGKIRSEENFILGLRNRMANSFPEMGEKHSVDKDGEGRSLDLRGPNDNCFDRNDNDDNNDDHDDDNRSNDGDNEDRIKRQKLNGVDFTSPKSDSSASNKKNSINNSSSSNNNNNNSSSKEGNEDNDEDDDENAINDDVDEMVAGDGHESAGFRKGATGPGGHADRALAWALGAAGQGLFSAGHNSVTLEPLAATSAAVAQSVDGVRPGGRPGEAVPEEVNVFRNMLFQLQQQQMMQIQMIQQMRRQLISSGVNPNLLPADIDLNLMTSEGLASVSAAMSGLQNAAAASSAVSSSSISGKSSHSHSHSLSHSFSHSLSHSLSHNLSNSVPLSANPLLASTASSMFGKFHSGGVERSSPPRRHPRSRDSSPSS
ncbi:dentin sialophosphoprotein, partial [Aplysia californica]|uniref:Dentin sialophosphoprotein n=1 Tax=Aplysia californica TaxID=6500 RepID=A0ABM0ZYS0_APLCA